MTFGKFKQGPRRDLVPEKKGLFGRMNPALSEALVEFATAMIGQSTKGRIFKALLIGAAVTVGKLVSKDNGSEE